MHKSSIELSYIIGQLGKPRLAEILYLEASYHFFKGIPAFKVHYLIRLEMATKGIIWC